MGKWATDGDSRLVASSCQGAWRSALTLLEVSSHGPWHVPAGGRCRWIEMRGSTCGCFIVLPVTDDLDRQMPRRALVEIKADAWARFIILKYFLHFSEQREYSFFCHILMWKYSLRFKMFDTVDFLAHIWSFVLFKKICKICKTICVHESIFNNESNDMKRINNYLNFFE